MKEGTILVGGEREVYEIHVYQATQDAYAPLGGRPVDLQIEVWRTVLPRRLLHYEVNKIIDSQAAEDGRQLHTNVKVGIKSDSANHPVVGFPGLCVWDFENRVFDQTVSDGQGVGDWYECPMESKHSCGKGVVWFGFWEIPHLVEHDVESGGGITWHLGSG